MLGRTYPGRRVLQVLLLCQTCAPTFACRMHPVVPSPVLHPRTGHQALLVQRRRARLPCAAEQHSTAAAVELCIGAANDGLCSSAAATAAGATQAGDCMVDYSIGSAAMAAKGAQAAVVPAGVVCVRIEGIKGACVWDPSGG